MKQIVECVPNFSEGRRKDVVEAIAAALTGVPGADETATRLNRNIDRLNALLYGPANYAALGRKG